ncbi:MAG: O-antigen ligase family protein [Acidobacteria bacterium]|nr:O-antigen ligase family protein [Acidobacteriota bacterium]
MVRPETSPSSLLALAVLVGIAVVSPWPFGAVQPWAILALTTAGLLAAAVALGLGAWRGDARGPAIPLWPLVGFVALGLGQLLPLPPAVHSVLAPGSYAVWHPAEPAAATVLGGGSSPVSLDPDSTLRSVALVVSLGLLASLAAPAFSRSRLAAAAVTTVAAGGFLLSAYAIFARARFGTLLYGHIPVPTVAPFGPFVSKNHFAGYVVMAALLTAGLALGLADNARGRGRDWTTSSRAGVVVLAMVAAVAMALAGLASLSRGGGIALAAGAASLIALLVLRARGGRRRRGLLPSVVLAGVLGLVLVALVPPETHVRMRSLSGASLRLDTWRDGSRLALSSPVVGSGLGAFHDAYPRFKRGHGLLRVEHAENDYVETLAETGLVGLGLVLAGGALLLTRSLRGGSGVGGVARGVGMGALAGLVALAVHSAVDFNLRIPSNAALAAVLASAAAGAAGVRPRPLSRRVAAVLGLLVIALLAAVVRLPTEPWLAAREEARLAGMATTPESRGLRRGRAEVALTRLLRRRPAHAESWLMLAGVRAASADRVSAASLAGHAVALDPERAALREAAEPLRR